MPTRGERQQIIRLQLDEQDLEKGLTIESLARQTKGYSGSDLHNFCQQAAWAWMNEQLDPNTDDITDESEDDHGESQPEEQTDQDQGSNTSEQEVEKTIKQLDELVTEAVSAELKLTQKHIEKALQMARPTVTSDNIRHLEKFARRFNPDQVSKLLSGDVVSDCTIESMYIWIY